MSALHGAAAWAADRGWRVHPLRGKVPLVRDWPDAATRDHQVIDDWWGERYPGAGVGLATGAGSGVWVLDVDGRHGRASLGDLQQRHGPLPVTVRAITPGSPREGRRDPGMHWYFRWVDGIRQSAGTLGRGLDTRADGGNIVLPPSPHPAGGAYRWDPEAHPDAIPVADTPEWLLELLRPAPAPPRETPVLPLLPRRPGRGYVAAAVEREVLELAQAPQGTRNDRLNAAAFSLARLVGQGIADEAAVRRALVLGARAAGLSDIEIQRTIRSAFRGRGVG